MVEKISVALAQLSDISDIARFQKMMAWETEQLELNDDKVYSGVSQVFQDPHKGRYYIAKDANGTAFASLLITYEWSDWRSQWVWWIQSVYVISQRRSQGVFQEMYRYVKVDALKEKAAALRLYVEKNNTHAQKVYQKIGMTNEHYELFEVFL